MDKDSPKKVLVIRFSSMGDIILTTPVLRCLSQQGNYRIDYLVKKKFAPVLQDNPYIHKIHILEDNLWSMSHLLRAENYDLIIDLHLSLRSYFLRLILFKRVISFKKLRIKKWLRTKIKRKLSKDRHISDRFLDTLVPLGIVNDNKGLDFFINIANRIELEPRETNDCRVALIPGAQHFTKRITDTLIDKIISSNSDILFYIVGGELEREKGIELEKYSNVRNYCGKLNLQQTASVIQQCNFAIGGDTGLMHISAALRKDIIVIWGSTVEQFGYYPYYPINSNNFISIETEGLCCRPCTKIGKSKCPLDHFKCMNEISTSKVLLAINELRLANV